MVDLWLMHGKSMILSMGKSIFHIYWNISENSPVEIVDLPIFIAWEDPSWNGMIYGIMGIEWIDGLVKKLDHRQFVDLSIFIAW